MAARYTYSPMVPQRAGKYAVRWRQRNHGKAVVTPSEHPSGFTAEITTKAGDRLGLYDVVYATDCMGVEWCFLVE